MSKKVLLSLILAGFCAIGFAQNDSVAKEWVQTEVTPKRITGSFIASAFINFRAAFADDKNEFGFELERAYLGYQCSFNKQFAAKVIFDVGLAKGSSTGWERFACIKNAMLTWTPGNFTFNIGLIGLEQFSLQDKIWGYRYIMKSFQDEYKFGYSADMGIVGKYKFAKWGSFDVSFTNGEGFKNLQVDNRFRYGLGLTFNPVQPLVIRLYADRHDKPETDTVGDAQYVTSFFTGYQNKHFSVGIEWNLLINHSFNVDRNLMGFSTYAMVKLPKKFELFTRWDYLISSRWWNRANDGHTTVIGFQYSPITHVKIAPNFRLKISETGKLTYIGFLSLSVTL